MHVRKSELSIVLICIFIFIFSVSPIIQAKSLYVAMHINSSVNAYKIQGSDVQFQTSTNYSEAISLALDPDSWTIFTTAEGLNRIYLLNAKTMIFEETPTVVEFYPVPNLAGIVFDQSKQKLYVIDRGISHLYVFFSELLTLETGKNMV